jgi:hypothetical protein
MGTTGWHRWKKMDESTVHSPDGDLLETMDAIGVYHAQRFGFNNTIPVLQASNSRVSETAFESFEEYAHIYPSLSSFGQYVNDHSGFYNQVGGTGKPSLQSTTAHTGRYSLAFASSTSLTFSSTVNDYDFISLKLNAVPIATTEPYVPFSKCYLPDGPKDLSPIGTDMIGNKKYLISFWVKGNTASTDYSGIFSTSISYTNTATSTNVALTPTVNASPVINGWQKFDYEIMIPNYGPATLPADYFSFKITATSGLSFDDFRLQPYNAGMVCTVYDPLHLRPWAILDDRNYATFIEYDNQGMAVRNKKETEKGIYTLKESRSSTVKK